MTPGALCAMLTGTPLMLVWFADNWGTPTMVSHVTFSVVLDISYRHSLCIRKTYIHTYAGATPYSFALYGNGSGLIHLDDVNCRGSESRLIDCPYDNNTNDCTHSEDAGVYCQCKYHSKTKACLCWELHDCCLASYYCSASDSLEVSDSLIEHFLGCSLEHIDLWNTFCLGSDVSW